ncbi:hypothetical protein LXA43DRAFT_1122982 [Ganoderma leucocontextum]|nr:hypothetical protein LXA43DRAFT_1122982 [Ganoderma leucocontextum]
MGKLNIAHHKSYHPYRRDNVERVRRDEEEARQKEAVEEGRMMLADSEARIDLLRQRAGLQGSKSRKDKDKDKDDVDAQIAAAARERVDGAEGAAAPGPSTTLTSRTGHINLFEDLEQQQRLMTMTMTVPVRSTKRGPPPAPPPKGESERETEKGVALAPSAKDLNPWYSDRHHGHDADGGPEVDNKRLRDLARKSTHDPLTAINSRLASRDGRPPPPLPARSRQPPPAGSRAGGAARGGDGGGGGGGGGSGTGAASASAERTSRESAERLRALELVRRRKREMGGSETPGTVRGGGHGSGSGSGTGDYGYGDVFNRRAVEEAHSRDKARRGWRDRDGRDGETEVGAARAEKLGRRS